MARHDHAHDHDHAGHDHGSDGESHGHAHGPGHSHGPGQVHSHGPDSERRIFWVMLLTGGFMLVEAVGGWLSGSLALLADAAHMLTDVGALALAWTAFRLARRPSDPRRSYGYHRFPVLAAFVNGIALFAIAIWITIEAIDRLSAPTEVLAGEMLIVALVGLAINVGAFLVLHGGAKESLNVRGALLHVLGDLLGSVAAILAAVVILLTGWTPIDPLLSVLVTVMLLWSAWRLIREAGHILLEGTPPEIDPARIGAAIRADVPEVVDVHHVHAWSLASDRPLVTLHAVLTPGSDDAASLSAIHQSLRQRFQLTHVTVQLERGPCMDHATI